MPAFGAFMAPTVERFPSGVSPRLTFRPCAHSHSVAFPIYLVFRMPIMLDAFYPNGTHRTGPGRARFNKTFEGAVQIGRNTTDASQLVQPLDSGTRLLVHPSPEGLTIAALAVECPKEVTRISASIMTEHADAGEICYSIALVPKSRQMWTSPQRLVRYVLLDLPDERDAGAEIAGIPGASGPSAPAWTMAAKAVRQSGLSARHVGGTPGVAGGTDVGDGAPFVMQRQARVAGLLMSARVRRRRGPVAGSGRARPRAPPGRAAPPGRRARRPGGAGRTARRRAAAASRARRCAPWWRGARPAAGRGWSGRSSSCPFSSHSLQGVAPMAPLYARCGAAHRGDRAIARARSRARDASYDASRANRIGWGGGIDVRRPARTAGSGEAALDGEAGGGGAVLHAELVVDRAQVLLHRAAAEGEPRRRSRRWPGPGRPAAAPPPRARSGRRGAGRRGRGGAGRGAARRAASASARARAGRGAEVGEGWRAPRRAASLPRPVARRRRAARPGPGGSGRARRARRRRRPAPAPRRGGPPRRRGGPPAVSSSPSRRWAARRASGWRGSVAWASARSACGAGRRRGRPPRGGRPPSRAAPRPARAPRRSRPASGRAPPARRGPSGRSPASSARAAARRWSATCRQEDRVARGPWPARRGRCAARPPTPGLRRPRSRASAPSVTRASPGHHGHSGGPSRSAVAPRSAAAQCAFQEIERVVQRRGGRGADRPARRARRCSAAFRTRSRGARRGGRRGRERDVAQRLAERGGARRGGVRCCRSGAGGLPEQRRAGAGRPSAAWARPRARRRLPSRRAARAARGPGRPGRRWPRPRQARLAQRQRLGVAPELGPQRHQDVPAGPSSGRGRRAPDRARRPAAGRAAARGVPAAQAAPRQPVVARQGRRQVRRGRAMLAPAGAVDEAALGAGEQRQRRVAGRRGQARRLVQVVAAAPAAVGVARTDSRGGGAASRAARPPPGHRGAAPAPPRSASAAVSQA